MNIIIRDVPASTSTNIRTEAARLNISQQELLFDLITQKFGEPPTVWGYIKIDRVGDLDIGEDCPACGEPAQSWWLQVTNTGEQHIMCGACATSE